MTETATSIQELLRPYAAAKCPFCDGAGCVKCGPEALDKRFDALRCKHTRVLDTRHDGYWCPDCGEHWWRGKPPVGLRTDLGSIVRAAATCGVMLTVVAQLDPNDPEGSAARAFVAAVPLP